MEPFCHRYADFGAVIHSFFPFAAVRLGLVIETSDNEEAERPLTTTDGGT